MFVLWVFQSSLFLLCCQMPTVDMGVRYNRWYYRGDDVYNTRYLDLGSLLYYCALNIAGHVYVCSVNMNVNPSHFYTVYNTIHDFYKTIFFAPFLFFVSAVIVLRTPHDLSETEGSVEYSYFECYKYN
jgi:hypothetical protein